jgi:hypothetical protein
MPLIRVQTLKNCLFLRYKVSLLLLLLLVVVVVVVG